jgi:hypothetical protein
MWKDDHGKSKSSSKHDVDDDSLEERDLYESLDPMVLIRKKINKENKELAHLLDILDQTLEVEERIKEVMTRIKTYKVITIISSGFIFMS